MPFEERFRPTYLRKLVFFEGERHNYMIINLRNRASVPVVFFATAFIGFYNPSVNRRMFFGYPAKKRGTKIKIHITEVIVYRDNFAVAVKYSRERIWAVAFVVNSVVPVVKRRRARLFFDFVFPRIFPWRLVKMPVDYTVFIPSHIFSHRGKLFFYPKVVLEANFCLQGLFRLGFR
jgi:hypothetical protein